MEPVTHILTGACLARAGFNRKAAYATLTMAVAAEFPDVDTVWSLRGPVEGFQHHRGITHTFLGLPFEAAFLVAAIYGLHRWRTARQKSRSLHTPEGKERLLAASPKGMPGRKAKPLTVAPVRWSVLYGLALVALLSHLLLDYTNNYGLRPFFPFNDRWYAASIVFIFDPAIFALLLMAFAAPAIFGLVGAEVGAKRAGFRGRGWAIAALVGIVSLWTLRGVEHSRAVDLAMAQSVAAVAAPQVAGSVPPPGESSVPSSEPALGGAPVASYLSAQRALASPDPLSPFHWSAVTDFGPLYQLAEIDTRSASLVPADTTFPKPTRSPKILAAERSPLGRAYLDWSPMPVLDVTQLAASSNGPELAEDTLVTFRDPRFMGGWMRDMGRSALTATVTVDRTGSVAEQTMDGRQEAANRK